MGFFKRTKAAVALSRKAREQLYECALNELEAGIVRRGLWAQALAKGGGDESRAKGVYLKLRVQSMLDENAIVDQLVDDLEGSGTPSAINIHPESEGSREPSVNRDAPIARSPSDLCPTCFEFHEPDERTCRYCGADLTQPAGAGRPGVGR